MSDIWNCICGFLCHKIRQFPLHFFLFLFSGNLLDAVVLPPHEDLNEWLAMNTVDFFNELTVFFEICEEGTKIEFKTGDG